MNKYLILALLLVMGAFCITFSTCNHYKKESKRLDDNQSVLMDTVRLYRTKDSLSVASVQILTLTTKELVKKNNHIVKMCEDLNVKLKRVQAANMSVSSSNTSFTTTIRDTIITDPVHIHDTIPLYIKAKSFNWQDPWTRVDGVLYNDSVRCTVNSIDTIIQIVHRVPKRFLFIKYGTKAIRQEIVSKNKHNTIIYTEHIQLKK